MKLTAWESLCVHYCKTFGISGADLFGADTESKRCYRPRRGRPRSAYPALMVSATLPFLLLASQRLTEMPIDKIAQCLKLDEWDMLEVAATAESRLATDPEFAATFEQFLDAASAERAQAYTVKQSVEMTFEEIAAELGICRQRVQQHYERALEKLRANPEVLAILMGAS